MSDEVLIRITEDGPTRYRDGTVSLGKHVWKRCPVVHAEHLMEQTEHVERACSTVKQDGGLCAEPYGSCRYHDTSDDEEEPEDSDDGAEG